MTDSGVLATSPPRFPAAGWVWRGLGCLVVLLCLAGPVQAQPPAWLVVMADSTIGFTATQMGAPFAGHFRRFEAEIRFDPDDLDGSSAEVLAEAASIDTGHGGRDATARDPDWFAVADHPVVRFATTRFRRLADGSYEADGTLSIKRVIRPVVLPFRLAFDGDLAVMTGSLPLRRGDYGVGTGQWRAPAIVGEEVILTLRLAARRRAP